MLNSVVRVPRVMLNTQVSNLNYSRAGYQGIMLVLLNMNAAFLSASANDEFWAIPTVVLPYSAS
jgi:hypothetical protein